MSSINIAADLDLLPVDSDGSRLCHCGARIASTGWTAHRGRHIREGNYTPPPAPKPKRKYTKKAKPNDLDEACLALLSHAGVSTVPISMISDVAAWVDGTKKLIGALK